MIVTECKGFARKNTEKVSGYVRGYVYFVLTSEVQARSTIVGNLTSAVYAH